MLLGKKTPGDQGTGEILFGAGFASRNNPQTRHALARDLRHELDRIVFAVRMAGTVMAGKKIDPGELRRQRLRRELRRRAARRKYLETNPDVDPTSEEAIDSPGTGKPRIKESDITGLKYFDKLAPLLERRHDEACERDKAGNRKLHFD